MFVLIFTCLSVLTSLLGKHVYCQKFGKRVGVCHDEEYDRVLGQYSVPNDMMITVNPQPVAFIFGLDFVLWNFSLIEDTKPPFKIQKDGTVVDQELKPLYMFPNAYNILKELRLRRHKLFLFANRSFTRNTKNLLKEFAIAKLFHVQYFMDGTRIQHIYKAYKKCDGVFEDMMYFDSDQMAVQSGRRMLVFSFCSEYGINYTLLNQALRYYQDHRKSMIRPYTYLTGVPTYLKFDKYIKRAYRNEEKMRPPSYESSSESEDTGKSSKDIFYINDKTYID